MKKLVNEFIAELEQMEIALPRLITEIEKLRTLREERKVPAFLDTKISIAPFKSPKASTLQGEWDEFYAIQKLELLNRYLSLREKEIDSLQEALAVPAVEVLHSKLSALSEDNQMDTAYTAFRKQSINAAVSMFQRIRYERRLSGAKPGKTVQTKAPTKQATRTASPRRGRSPASTKDTTSSNDEALLLRLEKLFIAKNKHGPGATSRQSSPKPRGRTPSRGRHNSQSPTRKGAQSHSRQQTHSSKSFSSPSGGRQRGRGRA
jgi:hypothetical protein